MKGYLHKVGKVWYTRVDLERYQSGRRHQRNIRLGAFSKAEAQAKEREVLMQLDRGTYQVGRQQTVADLLDAWLRANKPTLQAQGVSAKTYERYASIVRLQLKPHLGAIPLRRLAPEHIVNMLTSLREARYSGTTLHHIFGVLRNALNFATKIQRAIPENPALRVPTPHLSVKKPDVTEAGIQMLLEVVRVTRLEHLILVASMTGLRRGELLALRWSAINFDQKELVVSESLEESKMFGLRFKSTKSGRVRVLPLADALIRPLVSHKAAQELNQTHLGDAYQMHDLVFCNPDGSPWPPDTLTKQFAQIVRSHGVPKLRLHDVRHAFASIVLSQGTSVTEVSELLGHSSPMVTLSTYAHKMLCSKNPLRNTATEPVL
jgi:integrase